MATYLFANAIRAPRRTLTKYKLKNKDDDGAIYNIISNRITSNETKWMCIIGRSEIKKEGRKETKKK